MSKKILQAAAGAAGGESVYVEDVFSTYLYEGASTPQTITNGIDLSGEGGMVWIKCRDNAYDNFVFDTERTNKHLHTNKTDQEIYDSGNYIDYNSDGFDVEASGGLIGGPYSFNYASWTFRKQAGFFDVVTWTGDGTNDREISHNLGSVPGFIIIKSTSNSTDWITYHRSYTYPQWIRLNSTDAQSTTYGSAWSSSNPPTSTAFTLGSGGFGDVNYSGRSYIAYIFAHDDQSFGDDSDESIIKCGSYTGTGSSQEINLGFEPQWILIKNASSVGGWILLDTMRGWANSSSSDNYLFAHSSSAEAATDFLDITATGFIANSASFYGSGETYIYIAIRRPMKTPEAGTEVFSPQLGTASGEPRFVSGFPTDLLIKTYRYGYLGSLFGSRLTGSKYMSSAATTAESTDGAFFKFDYQNGTSTSGDSNDIGWMFKRARGFCDVVAYTGDGNNPRSVNHNLGVVPEFIAIKKRSAEGNWWVWVNGLTDNATYARNLQLSETDAEASNNVFYKSSDQSSTAFKIGAGFNGANDSSANYIAYLFATVAGVSKVGSFTSSGTDINIDCGFTSGARFVLLKKTNDADDWFVWDTARGIVAGNDKRLKLNTSDAEATGADNIDPYSAGFTLTSGIIGSGNTFIYLAIA